MPLSPRREARIGPNLRPGSYQVTSPEGGTYNCIAFAFGSTSLWMWPADEDAAWPDGVLNEESVAALVALFESIGYERSVHGGPVAGSENVAIYADEAGIPTHASVQRADGPWTSKLGGWEDISHVNSDVVAGALCGKPVVDLWRKPGG
ncbi:MAG: hypothetical protein AB7T37_15080 [Dehalococcoidia bacterium]